MKYCIDSLMMIEKGTADSRRTKIKNNCFVGERVSDLCFLIIHQQTGMCCMKVITGFVWRFILISLHTSSTYISYIASHIRMKFVKP